jgi:hypothetical protein
VRVRPSCPEARWVRGSSAGSEDHAWSRPCRCSPVWCSGWCHY